MAGEIVPAKQSADNALIALIATAAQDQSIDVAKLQQLVELRERILEKEAEIAFNAAMNAAQSEMLPIMKDAENPHAHSRYATLEKVDREVRPIYTKHGFCLTFNTATPASVGAVHVTCEVRHSAGHKKEYYLEGDLDVSGSQGKSNKTSIQGLGSSVSYLRRYLTLMIFNLTLTNEDNDGNRFDPKEYQEVRDRKIREAQEGQARRMARQAPLSEPPTQLQEELAESITQAKLRKPKKDWTKFEILGLFREMKKRYEALDSVSDYYKVLGMYGMEKSNDFEDDDAGREKARKAYKHMQLNIQDLEAYYKKQQEETQTHAS